MYHFTICEITHNCMALIPTHCPFKPARVLNNILTFSVYKYCIAVIVLPTTSLDNSSEEPNTSVLYYILNIAYHHGLSGNNRIR